MNEGLDLFRQLTPEEMECRLRRCGIEADSDSIGRRAGRTHARDSSHTYSHGQDPTSYRQHYRVVIFNLAVLECQPLGAGAAMSGVSPGAAGQGECRDVGAGGEGRGEYGHIGSGVVGRGEYRVSRSGAGGQGEYSDGGSGADERDAYGNDGSGVAGRGEHGNSGSGADGRDAYGNDGSGVAGRGEHGDSGSGAAWQGEYGHGGSGAARLGQYGHGGSEAARLGEYGYGGSGAARLGEYGDGGSEAAGQGLYGESSLGYGGGELRGAAGVLRSVAVRALYTLGLDSGEVELRAMGGRRYVVTAITPVMAAPGRPLPEPYRSASAELDLRLGLEQPGRPGLLMGMDPEFLLLRESNGRVVPASRYLPMDGVAGCDAGPPGTHGVFPVAELRPEPRGEPRALLAQLMSAAREADRLITDRSLRWRAGGMPLRGWALGGHLHFSGVTLCAPLLRALDNYLALPLFLLEDVRAAARRPRYGVLGDFRRQPHGGFEYRTLPSFLVSPVIAKGAVSLAHLIVSHYEDLPLRPLDREALHAAFYSGDKTPLRTAWSPLEAQLRALGGYAAAALWIEPMLRSIAEQQSWDETRDIRGSWQSSARAAARAPHSRQDTIQ
ncbi:hypothetical protein KDC22_18690 [Paenibacillus tritici]|uniref:putative amidoligase domain-containing protein n=1 Tax=Paenibacillus tritici TaxID=1873425 RepID=UPI001BA5A968|nr:hypothetical protein [Paenibacillus tritici]QUL52481.1 hypothetical protein KDC22_18690 [Paenibacillus tritici]